MAEISYPFNEANANGGSQIVSQTQWQAMAALWGGDYVEHTFTGTAQPFAATVVNGRQVMLRPGRSMTGGFYYQLTSNLTVSIESNSSSYVRIDLIVVRADLSRNAVNIAVLKGTAAATPVAPALRREAGGIWEMPLHQVTAAAKDASVTVENLMPCKIPQPVAYHWNSAAAAELLPPGTMSFDMDVDRSDAQREMFNSYHGVISARHLSKSRTYTPGLVNSGSLSASLRKGRWRWIAPNMVWFQATIDNTTSKAVEATGSNWRVGITLPVVCNPGGIQVMHGYVSNPDEKNSMPNMFSVTGTTHPKSNILYLSTQSYTKLAEGLDGLRLFPAKSTFSISGIYECNQFNE